MNPMTLPPIDRLLQDRIVRLAQARGWTLPQTLLRLIEQGLNACEAELKAGFSEVDAKVLQEAIAALETIPNDPGFSLIGRVPKAGSGG